MIDKESEYVYVKVKHDLKNTTERGLLVGIKKIKFGLLEEEFLVLLTNKYTLKIFNLLYYDIMEVDIKLKSIEYKVINTDITTETTVRKTIEEIISYMGEINNLIDNTFIDINFYSEVLTLIKESNTIQTVETPSKEPSLFVIKRKLPLLDKEAFIILHNKAHSEAS